MNGYRWLLTNAKLLVPISEALIPNWQKKNWIGLSKTTIFHTKKGVTVRKVDIANFVDCRGFLSRTKYVKIAIPIRIPSYLVRNARPAKKPDRNKWPFLLENIKK